ncbi:MAG TPA: carboxypeptidase-like regulatory domain-containing protein [Terriglobales bacterium]|nr:carboxypeptidase-like regulatory domain-containing protein [Terriglobales bacterium]
MYRPRISTFVLVLTAACCLLASQLLLAQSSTTGEISGTVSDPSGAVVSNVPVTLKSIDKGYTQSATSNSQGAYRFSLLAPGNYAVSATAPGFKTTTVTQPVAVGAVAIANITMELGTTGTTVEVSGDAPLLQADSSEISTTMNTLAVQSLPNPGNDLSFIAQTAPGSVMNTESGFGNFSSFGISATSNLFTMNGMYDNDPFLNVNNSGATNLLLGNNEVQEASVTSNGYSGQFGGFAGATVNYVTKSGSNQFHGNAAYWWNGSAMNANDWFHNNTTPVTPRTFDNANQWAASFGGPIKKDKAFFFANYEGLRVLVPVTQTVTYPSPQFQTSTLANLAAIGQAAQIPYFQNMFNLWNNAPGASRSTPIPLGGTSLGGCSTPAAGGLNGVAALLPGAPLFGSAVPCAKSFQAADSALTHEFLLAGRVDVNLTNTDKIFIRAQEDKGLQATYTDPITPLFNTTSDQPEYQSQASWNHSFGTKAVNNLVAAFTYYSAIFNTTDRPASLAAYPTTLFLGDGTFSNSFEGTALGGINFDFPQGRNVTQYQFVDDFSYTLGTKHTLKLGENFHRYDIGDHDLNNRAIGLLIPFDISSFYAGGTGGTQLQQNFSTVSDVPIGIYGLGWYVQDEWRATPGLKVTLALRMDHNSNPVCQIDCFAHLASEFSTLDHNPAIPYNQALVTGQHAAATSYPAIMWQPRLGIAWTPFGLKNTVIRGGIGLFADTFPGQVADNAALNPPNYNSFSINSAGALAGGGTGVNANVPGSVFTQAAQINAAFTSVFANGGTVSQLPPGTLPNINTVNTVKDPMYAEWNLQLQQGIGANTSITLNYVGNHGYHETVNNQAVNGYCPVSACPNGFAGLPSTPIDSRFNDVNQIQSIAVSNYNGLTTSVQHRFSYGLQLQGNFTWSHALDEISNGGFLPFTSDTNTSVSFPVEPDNIRRMYGNADYDTRKYFSLSYVYEVPFRFGPRPLLQGWQLSGTVFSRSGLPYTVTDSAAVNNVLAGSGYGNTQTLFAGYNGAAQGSCGVGAASATNGAAKTPCLNAADFSPVILPSGATSNAPIFGFGNQGRNQFFGPGYFDTDFTVMKYTGIPHWEGAKLGIGVQFFNILNHPNFDQPVRDISNGSGQFGQILRMVNTPTSILGSFLGGDAAPRLIQLSAKFNF